MADFVFIPGESFNGSVARWVDTVLGGERMIDITTHAGVTYGHRQYAASASPQQITAMAQAMAVDPRELLARAMPRIDADAEVASRYDRYLFHGVQIPGYLIEKHRRRFSPGAFVAALADEDVGVAYHKAVWQIRAFPFCTVSWRTLLDRCPHCDQHPGWQATLGIDRCEHGMHDLKEGAGDLVTKDLRPALVAAVGLVDHHPDRRAASLALLPERISSMGPSFALDLLVNLLPVLDPALPTDPAHLFKAPALQICRAVASAWRAMVGWPDAMLALASNRIATRSTKHSDGNGGRTIRFLSSRWNTGISSDLLDLIAEWRAEIDLDGPNRDAILERTKSITDAARLTGLGSAEVADLRRAGALPTVFVVDAGRPEPRFPAEAFETIAGLIEVRMPIERARLAVGVTCNGIEQLVAMRLLDREEHPFITARYDAMQIVATSIDRLADRLAEEARGDPDICLIPLHSAMKAIGGRLKPWGPAFQALVDTSSAAGQRIEFVLAPGDAPLSRRILIAQDDIERFRGLAFNLHDPAYRKIIYAETMSKIDAGEVLNLGFSQSIPLLAAITTKTGTHEKHVPVAYVLRLANEHIAPTEIAARRGITAQAAWRDARAKGVPKLGPGGFCRVEAEKRLFDDAKPGEEAA